MRVGYYSLIQYCPDPAKLEAASVGVALFDPATCQFDFKTAGVRRVHTFFGRDQIGSDQFADLVSSFAVRLKRAGKGFVTPDDIEDFAGALAGEIVMSPPRPVAIDVFETRLAELAAKLIDSSHKASAVSPNRSARRQLASEFKKPQFNKLVEQKVRFTLPELEQDLVIPYGYRNGRYNLIQPANFAARGGAGLVGMTGRFQLAAKLVFESRSPRGPMQLIVVADFATEQRSEKGFVESELLEAHAKFYTADSLPQLLAEIRDHAKPLDVPAAPRHAANLFVGDPGS